MNEKLYNYNTKNANNKIFCIKNSFVANQESRTKNIASY